MEMGNHMRMLMSCLAALAWTAAAHAEPLSYDYAYLSHQEVDTENGRANNDVFGMHYELGKHLHVFGSYGDAGAYGNPSWKDSRALRLGLAGRRLFGENTMLAFKAAVVRAQFDRPTGETVKDDGTSLILEVRHRFKPWLEAIASGSRNDVLGWKTTEYVAGPVFHVHQRVALGALYRRIEGNAGFEATLRWYY